MPGTNVAFAMPTDQGKKRAFLSRFAQTTFVISFCPRLLWGLHTVLGRRVYISGGRKDRGQSKKERSDLKNKEL